MAVKKWVFWHVKKPLEPFFGPDDYVGWGTVQQEMDAHRRVIDDWHSVHKQLSFWDRIRHFFCDGGCFVTIKDHAANTTTACEILYSSADKESLSRE